MNPLKWQRQHLIALLIFVAVGFFIGVVIGFFVYAADSGAEGSASFNTWIGVWFWSRAVPWGVFGGVISGATAYATKLMRDNH